MRIPEILASGQRLLGQRLNIEGYFVMAGGKSYFVDTVEGRDDLASALRVVHDDLSEKVMTKVPPSGGSKYYYLDSARVTGTLAADASAEFPLRIENVDSFEIEKSGYRIQVLP